MEDSRKKKSRTADRALAPKKLKLLVTVVDKGKSDFYVDLLHTMEANLQLKLNAQGTAGSEMLHYLGLEENEKCVLFSIIREDRAGEIMQTLKEKFETVRGGKGIAYTIPLSSVAGVAIYQFLSNNRRTVGKEKK